MLRIRLLPRSLGLVIVSIAIVACIGPSSTSQPIASPASQTGIRGVVTAGPTCPVEKNPPDPACAPRPVAGATIVIQDASGKQAAAAVAGADGSFSVELPPGDYVVAPQPVPGLMGTAAPQGVSVTAGLVTVVKVDYDTGIR